MNRLWLALGCVAVQWLIIAALLLIPARTNRSDEED